MNDTDNTAASGAIAGQLAYAAAAAQEHLHIDQSAIKQIGALSVAATSLHSQGNAHHLVLPPEFKHIDLTGLIEKTLPAPHRKAGTVALGDLVSFLTFVDEQSYTHHCYIYADPDSRTLTAVLNDHERDGHESAGWRDYRAVFKAELSREFHGWFSNNKKVMEQEEFAIFLEDNVADIASPSGEDMLAVALTLQAKTEVSFSSHRRLDNGQVQLSYSETIDARAGNGAIDIPREFALGLRLFKNGEGYRLRARLKYRLHAGKVKFWYELDRAENAVEDAFSAYVEQARQSGFTVLIGKP
jgi:uncharacterized protein YfdQ (DUF2303 family)